MKREMSMSPLVVEGYCVKFFTSVFLVECLVCLVCHIFCHRGRVGRVRGDVGEGWGKCYMLKKEVLKTHKLTRMWNGHVRMPPRGPSGEVKMGCKKECKRCKWCVRIIRMFGFNTHMEPHEKRKGFFLFSFFSQRINF